MSAEQAVEVTQRCSLGIDPGEYASAVYGTSRVAVRAEEGT